MNQPPKDLRTRTTDFGIAVVELYQQLPQTPLTQTLGAELLRAGTAVGAHYREVSRTYPSGDLLGRLESTLQQLDATDYWLTLLERSGSMPPAAIEPVAATTRDLLKKISAIALEYQRLQTGRQQQATRVREGAAPARPLAACAQK